MKLLVTGRPSVGKSTLVANTVQTVALRHGFLTQELRHDGKRTAFVLHDSQDRNNTLARTETPTSYPVGRFFVDPEALDSFLTPLFDFGPNELLYIDEIGQMQLCSPSFRKLVLQYLDSPNDFIGTITSHYTDDFTQYLRNRTDILLIHLAADNREAIANAIVAALKNREQYSALPHDTQESMLNLAKGYLISRQYASLYKLFNNTVIYLHEKRVHEMDIRHYQVRGFTNSHIISRSKEQRYTCDCPLYLGSQGNSMECSHIQAVKLTLATTGK